MMRGRAVVIHGGGPTAVINASLAGVVEECRRHSAITGLYGAVKGDLVDLFAQDPAIWERVSLSPGSVLGSSRKKLEEQDYVEMVRVFQERDVRFVFLNGGNGTMETASRLSRDLQVIGIPKTIDNDLAGTDHTPGYGSAARFFAHALRDIGADNRALPGVSVVEVLGRNVGWLAAATSLARHRSGDAPHLIYFPERALPLDRLFADVERVYRKQGRCVIAVCEGQLDETGQPFGADVRTSSRAPLALNLAHVLAQRISAALKISARSEKPGLLGRSCAALASAVDREEARMCGAAAVRAAVAQESGKMVTLIRAPGSQYECSTGLVDLAEVAGRERPFPAYWIPDSADCDLPLFRAWAGPLIGTVEPLALLDQQ